MSEYQTQNTPDAPWNAPDWSGENHCPECNDWYRMDEHLELKGCHSHLKTVEKLQEYASEKVKEVNYWKRKARAWEELYDAHTKDDAQKIAALEKKVLELDSRCRYKEATIQELLDGLEALGRSLNAERGR